MKVFNKTTQSKAFGRDMITLTLEPAEAAGERGPGVEVDIKVHAALSLSAIELFRALKAGEIEFE